MTGPNYLKNQNYKLGKNIWSFPLPLTTCEKYRTPMCFQYCYARHGGWTFKNTQTRLAANYELSQHSYFEDGINADLVEIRIYQRKHQINGPIYIRLHPCGDFYSQHYFEKWCKIAICNSDVRILAFTRNWELNTNVAPSNFKIFYSIDKTSHCTNPTINQYSFLVKGEDFEEGSRHKHMEPYQIPQTIDYMFGRWRYLYGVICNSKCRDCKACWYLKEGNIVFFQRWQCYKGPKMCRHSEQPGLRAHKDKMDARKIIPSTVFDEIIKPQSYNKEFQLGEDCYDSRDAQPYKVKPMKTTDDKIRENLL